MGWGKSKKAAEPEGGRGRGPGDRKAPDVGLTSCYDFIQYLGSGGSGDTYLMRDLKSEELVAVKLIPRPIPKAIVPAHVFREIKIQAQLGEGHASIVNAREAVLTEKHLALVMEYAAGGSLTAYVSQRWQHATHTGLFLGEDEARYFFRQFLNAVDYCHARKVAHRDLKLDNTLLTDTQPPTLKLCDFGFARGWTQDAESNMYTHIGTPCYMSPELIDSRHGLRGYDGMKADAWACGVLLIAMLLGTFPFDHQKHPDPNTHEAQLEVWLQQVGQPWAGIPHIRQAIKRLSTDCRDLLDRIFVVDEKKRISIQDMKKHPWYNKPLPSRLLHAERYLLQEQELLEAHIAERVLDDEKIEARDARLHEMIELARVRPERTWRSRSKPLMRIDLQESSVLRTDPGGSPALASGHHTPGQPSPTG